MPLFDDAEKSLRIVLGRLQSCTASICSISAHRLRPTRGSLSRSATSADRTRILQKVLLGLHIACLAMLDACSVQSLLETRDIVIVYLYSDYG